MAEDLKAGTLGQDGGEGQPTGTPDGEGGNADQTPSNEALQAEIAKLKQEKAQHLAEKSTYEQAKRELEARGASPGQSSAAHSQSAWDDLQQDIRENEALAGSDPAARLTLKNLRMLEQIAINQQNAYQAATHEAQLAAVPSEYRDKVKQFFHTNRNRFADPTAAYDALLGQEYREKETTIKKREAELKDAEEARRNGIKRTTVRGVTSEEHAERKRGGEMAFSEYRKRVNAGEVQLVNQKDSGALEIDYSR